MIDKLNYLFLLSFKLELALKCVLPDE
uniref:Uncharacterized protein n=1 Tax=Arundo donax TaxID=35708 RepID=A0A0A9TJG0_ARUDO